jgi:protein-S-isoprenylcysteine O-methyltransferase Ste14
LTARSYNRTLALLRLGAVYALLAALLMLAHPTPLGVSIGFVIAAIGEAIRFWAAGHLVKTAELVTSGPYRYTRNPLYLGRLLIFTGICVMTRLPYGLNWVVLGLGYLVFFGYYLFRKERVEPARLAAIHGEAFDRYFRAVPALFPTRKPYPDTGSAGWSSDRMLRNREHWMILGLLTVTLFLLWRSYATPRIGAPLEDPSPAASDPIDHGAQRRPARSG